MGKAAPLPGRILAALEAAGRPLTVTELAYMGLSSLPRAIVQAEVDRMVAAGELVDLGDALPVHPDRRSRATYRRLYGLKGGTSRRR